MYDAHECDDSLLHSGIGWIKFLTITELQCTVCVFSSFLSEVAYVNDECYDN